jgi:hypothetical protein
MCHFDRSKPTQFLPWRSEGRLAQRRNLSSIFRAAPTRPPTPLEPRRLFDFQPNDLGNYFSRSPNRVISTGASRRIFFLREAKVGLRSGEISLRSFAQPRPITLWAAPRATTTKTPNPKNPPKAASAATPTPTPKSPGALSKPAPPHTSSHSPS